jgi:hypothetical protein
MLVQGNQIRQIKYLFTQPFVVIYLSEILNESEKILYRALENALKSVISFPLLHAFLVLSSLLFAILLFPYLFSCLIFGLRKLGSSRRWFARH